MRRQNTANRIALCSTKMPNGLPLMNAKLLKMWFSIKIKILFLSSLNICSECFVQMYNFIEENKCTTDSVITKSFLLCIYSNSCVSGVFCAKVKE